MLAGGTDAAAAICARAVAFEAIPPIALDITAELDADAETRNETRMLPAPASKRAASLAASLPPATRRRRRWLALEPSETELSETSAGSTFIADAIDNCKERLKAAPAVSTDEYGMPPMEMLALIRRGAKAGLQSNDELVPVEAVPEPAGHGRHKSAEREAVLNVCKGHCCKGAPLGQYTPPGQVLHVTAFGLSTPKVYVLNEKNPASQDLQLSIAFAPIVSDEVPAGHERQLPMLPAAILSDHVLAGQGTHPTVRSAGENVPLGH